jgi:hypothetical protein
MSHHEESLVLPNDEHNRVLVDNVHPPTWVNPDPTGRYNIVVIGAGTAGLITAVVATGLGAKVALIERHLVGGDCLNVGCVPSKGVIRAARAWSDLKHAEEFGLHIPPGVRYDFGAVMARMRKLRAQISHNDSAHRYKSLGVDVYIGHARFADTETVEVAGPAGNQILKFVGGDLHRSELPPAHSTYWKPAFGRTRQSFRSPATVTLGCHRCGSMRTGRRLPFRQQGT